MRTRGIYHLLFVSLYANICNGYLWCGLTQGDEIWQEVDQGGWQVISYFDELWPSG